MSKKTKNIHGGLDLDTSFDFLNEDKLVDAVNVSHNTDGRLPGVLHPSLGIDQANFVFRNRSKLTLERAIVAFQHPEYSSKLISINNIAFYFKVDKDAGTLLYRIEANPEYDDFPEVMSNSEEYIVTCVDFYRGQYFDASWQMCVYEFNEIYSIFLTHPKSQILCINTGNLIHTNIVTLTNSADPTLFPKPEIIGIKEIASLATPSITRYVYRVRYLDDTLETFSLPSSEVHIPGSYPRDPVYDETISYATEDRKHLFKSKLTITIGVNFGEAAGFIPNATTVEFYAIRKTDPLLPEIVEHIFTTAYSKNTIAFDGVHYFETLKDLDTPVDEDTSLNLASYVACTIKDSVLYVGNQNESTKEQGLKYLTPPWDPRAWQFNSDKEVLVDKADGTIAYFDMGAIANKKTEGWIFHQNNCKDAKDSAEILTKTPKLYAMYCQDGVSYGAEGPNVRLEFIVGAMDYGNVYADKISAEGMKFDTGKHTLLEAEYNFSPIVSGISPSSPTVGLRYEDMAGSWLSEDTVRGVKAHTVYNFYKNANVTQNAPLYSKNFVKNPDSGGHSFANPFFASHFRCLQHDSVYRFGCVVTLDNGVESDVFYIGDFKTPSMSLDDYQLFVDHVMAYNALIKKYPTTKGTEYEVAQFVELRFFPLYLRVWFKNLDKIANYPVKNIRMVYGKRSANDRNVVTTGAIHRTHDFLNPNLKSGTKKLENLFWSKGTKVSIPPLPTLGKSRYYFGGANCFCETDWNNAAPRYYTLKDSKIQGMSVFAFASRDWLVHNSPDTHEFVVSVDGVYKRVTKTSSIEGGVLEHVTVAHSYYASPVIINNTTVEANSYLFYAPEIDIEDIDGKPLVHELTSVESNVNNIVLHYGLSSIMPAGTNRSMISCLHSNYNLYFSNFYKKSAESLKIVDFLDVSDTTHHFSKYNYDGIYRTFKIWTEFSGGSWNRNGCIMSTNITTLFSPIPAGVTSDKVLWPSGKISSLKRHASNEYHYDAPSVTEPELHYVSTTNNVKTAKYFIKWGTYGKEQRLTNVVSSLSGKVWNFIKNNSQGFDELFQFLFPCSFSHRLEPAYATGVPYSIPIEKDNFINFCSLWSGAYYIRGDDKTAGFAENSFITQSTCMNRNRAGSISNTKTQAFTATLGIFQACAPAYWTNSDATIVPFSDHGQSMSLNYADLNQTANNDPRKDKGIDARFTENATAGTLNSPQDGNRDQGVYVVYDISQLPAESELIFPDVTWDEWPTKYYQDYADINVNTNDGYVVNNAVASGKFPYITDDSLSTEFSNLREALYEAAVEENPEAYMDSGGNVPSSSPTSAIFAFTYNYTTGLNYTGRGGSAIFIKFENDSTFPGVSNFSVNHTIFSDTTGTYFEKVVLDDANAGPRSDVPVNSSAKLTDCLNYGSHVVLATVRKKCIPFSDVEPTVTPWVATDSDCVFEIEDPTAVAGPFYVYGFDTFVGVHKRMYLNAFYPNGFGVKGEGAFAASSPIRMMFPYEGRINVDIANVTDEMDNNDNPGASSLLKRIAPNKFAGSSFKVGTVNSYTPKKGDFSYNTVYSHQETKTFLQTMSPVMNKLSAFPERVRYSQFDFSSGKFPAFKAANYIDLDKKYGQITKLFPHGLELLMFQERAVSSIVPNARTLFQQQGDSRGLYVQSGSLLSDGIKYLTTIFGSSVNTDVFATSNSIYWVDVGHHAILKYDKGGNFNNIAESGGVITYMKALAFNVGEQVVCQMYRLRDGNVRFRFSHTPFIAADDPFTMSAVDRRVLEYNESLNLFSSFITLGNFDVVPVSSKNIYINQGLIFEEGYYDAWHFFEGSEVSPVIEMYINPNKSLDDKRFISCTIEENDQICKDIVIDLRVEYQDNPAIERALQMYHYQKPEFDKSTDPDPIKILHLCADIPNRNIYTGKMEGIKYDDISKPANQIVPDINTRRLFLSMDKGVQWLGRAIPFGRSLNVAFDSIHKDEMNTPLNELDELMTGSSLLGGGGIISKGILLKIHFQSFNKNSTDEIGRTPDCNLPETFGGKYKDIRRRGKYYFLPIRINYEDNT